MSYTFDQIREFVLLMQADQGPILQKMRDILMRYEGDYVIPMVDVENEPRMPQLTPALVGEAIDQVAMRATSVTPRIVCPPLDPRKDTGVRSRQFATMRGQIITATLERSRWNLGRRRYYRHLSAYHTASMCVAPDMINSMPRLEVRDPLSTFVEPTSNESLLDPNYVAFVNRHSGQHIRDRYPKARAENGGPITDRHTNELWDVVEWYDRDEIVYGLIGPCEDYGSHVNTQRLAYGSPSMELVRLPNRAGMVPAVVPHNVSLGRISSRIGAMLGNTDLQAKLMALNIIAQEKAIFPDVYVLGRQGLEPQLTSGEWKDGRTGDINMVMDAEAIGVLRTTPDPTTGQTIDRLERNFRTSTGLVPQLGGETYGALRTGRGIDALAGMALDPRVQELHEVTEAYQSSMHKAILATYKGYWGSKSYSMYTGQANSRLLVEFTPDVHIESLENSVSYLVAGADAVQLTQILGSLYGAKAISRRSFRDGHPYIANADLEDAAVREEELEEALMQSVIQQVVGGQLPPIVLTMVRDVLANGKDIFEAMKVVDEKLRERQSTPPEAVPEGMVAAPEQMPGLAGGPGAAQAPPPVDQQQVTVPGDVSRMKQLLQTMGG